MLVRVLLACPERALRTRVSRALADRSVITSELGGGENLFDRLGRQSSDVVLLSRRELPSDAGAMRESIAALRRLPDRPELVVFIDQEDSEVRAALLSAGALAVISKKLSDDALGDTLRAVLRRRRDEAQRSLRAERAEERSSLADFVSKSPSMGLFLDLVRRIVPSSSSLLILGETGVGKERLARAVHFDGPRGAAPFLAVNCAALPESLLESELFGHEEGAFTGATRARRGYFELAHRGTIFLDEIGELPPHLQAKLLRVLQERRIQPIGADSSIGVDVRVMAATNRDLVADVRTGRFRADLFYRLGVVTLTVPPLRERREDIPALVESYVEHFRRALSRQLDGVDGAAIDAMLAYGWPGNVRELINVVERAVLITAGPKVVRGDLPPEIQGQGRAGNAPGATVAQLIPADDASLISKPWHEARAEALADFERRYLSALLQACGGRVGEAARRAGMDPRSLYDRSRRLGIRKEQFRWKPPARALDGS